MAEDTKLKKNHMAIVLGIGLGVVLLIVLSLILTIIINRRDRQSFLSSRKNPSERLRKVGQGLANLHAREVVDDHEGESRTV
ncbi:Zinc finger RING-type [Penicillium expansum]|nr:Zinc finger RING-type [Penicillium expansum]